MTFIHLLAAGLLFGPQQPPSQPKTTASVEGRIINSVSGQPMTNITVLLRPENQTDASAYAEDSDGNGKFRIEDVAPGEYILTAQRQGFMLQQPGGRSAPPFRLTIETGQHIDDVVLRLAPQGVIVGRVIDQEGDPVRGATVFAMNYGYVSGKRELVPLHQVQSNDKGDFRLYGLQPATYYVQASKRSTPSAPENIRGPRPPAGFAATYYPSSVDAARAVPVEVSAGAQIRGIDIRIRHEAAYVARFKTPPGEGATTPMYSPIITRREGQRSAFMGGMRMTNERIEFPDLLPGSYSVVVIQIDGANRKYASREFNIVDQDFDGGTLIFLPAVDMSGEVRLVGAKPASFPRFFVNLIAQGPAMSQPPAAEIKQEGAFTIHAVSPGAYHVQMEQQPGLYIKLIQFADQPLSSDHRLDVSNGGSGPLLIVLGADIGQIEGSVKKSNGDPAVNTRVSALAYGEHLGNLDYSRTVFTDQKGHFLMKSVPPADYKVFAWEDVEIGAPQDPEFRKPFEKQGVAVKLAPNGHESIELTSIVTKNADQQ